MDLQKLTSIPPADTFNIKYAQKFSKREIQQVSCGFDFCDSLGHANFVQEILSFHNEVLAALETEGFQRVRHESGQILQSYLEMHQKHARLTHNTTDDNIRLVINYGLNWVSNGVINDPSSVNHGMPAQFPILVLNLASVCVNASNGRNRIQTDSVVDIPLQGDVYIAAGGEYEDTPSDDQEDNNG